MRFANTNAERLKTVALVLAKRMGCRIAMYRSYHADESVGKTDEQIPPLLRKALKLYSQQQLRRFVHGLSILAADAAARRNAP